MQTVGADDKIEALAGAVSQRRFHMGAAILDPDDPGVAEVDPGA